MKLFKKYIYVGESIKDVDFPEGVSCCHRDPELVRCPVCKESSAQWLPYSPWKTIHGKWCRADFCDKHNLFSLDGTEFEMCEEERYERTEGTRKARDRMTTNWMFHAYLVGLGIDVMEAWDIVYGDKQYA